ncbi:MAG: AraC family transcriptional regulator [Thalassobaculaceae bacterium]|nr:AraC family transcriptional regulator [Thalassobaculaceae bacterium]
MEQPDILSEVFSTLRLSSALYFRAALAGRFAVEVPEEARRIRFHLVRHGSCWVSVPGTAPVRLAPGDVALIPNGARQTLSADPDLTPVPLAELMVAGAVSDGVLRYGDGAGGGGAGGADLLCGFCAFDEHLDHPVLRDLPALIVLRPGDLGAEPWMAAGLRLLQLEADLAGPGGTAILSRLIEVIVIQASRRAADALRDRTHGFLVALADPALAKVLTAIHGAPERDWRVVDLARIAALSRAGFARRFADTLGVTPIDYLTDWRLAKARGLLADTRLSMDDIAERCGYRSVPSFTRRFKARFDEGPGRFRRSRLDG